MNKFLTLLLVAQIVFSLAPAVGQEKTKLIDINSASLEQLTSIKGIGEKTAANILEYRAKVGQLEKMSQLTNVYRIGAKTVAQLACRFMVPAEGPLPCGVPQAVTVTKGKPVAMDGAAVNINLATEEELTSIKGIGPKKAEAILAFREQNGFFQSVDDLSKIKGFGPKTVAKFRPFMATHVNLNTASVRQLQALGFANAAKIIEFRDMFKGFKSLKDLITVPGTDKALVERLRPLLLLK